MGIWRERGERDKLMEMLRNRGEAGGKSARGLRRQRKGNYRFIWGGGVRMRVITCLSFLSLSPSLFLGEAGFG